MTSLDPALRRLTLACLLPGFVGPEPPHWLLDALADGVGGLVLFGSNLGDGTQVRALTDRLRDAAGRQLVLATDEEGGDVTRLDTVRGSASPGAAALGYLDDPDVTEDVYAVLAKRLADAGITMNLAPVADVNLEPANPVIGVRSFSADPVVAARHVAAAVRGTQRGGVVACVKHFPGHGATSSDSHHEVAILHRKRDELAVGEFVPFRAAIEAGTRAVMTGHLIAPALDPDNLATVSAAVTRVLRDELGFDGAIVTDALEMKALADSIGMAAGFVEALRAGADLIETGAQDYPDLIEQIPVAVQDAVDSGRLATARLEEAAARARALAIRPDVGSISSDRLKNYSPRGLVEVIGELPVLERPLVVECRTPNNMATGVLPWSVAERIAAAVPGTDVLLTEGGVPDVSATGRTVVGVIRDPIRYPWQRPLIERADVVVDVGWPADLPPSKPAVRTRGIAPVLLDAAVSILTAVGVPR